MYYISVPSFPFSTFVSVYLFGGKVTSQGWSRMFPLVVRHRYIGKSRRKMYMFIYVYVH